MKNIKNTYFGFTDKIKEPRKTKVEDTLDMIFNVNDMYMSRKEYIIYYLKEGRNVEVEENYSYYSPKLDGYTKPKTERRLIDQESGNYIVITKTEYDFANHIIENGFLNDEKASQFVRNETIAKEEAERVKKEIEEKDRQKREEKARCKREEENKIRNEKIAHWERIGRLLMNKEIENLSLKIINDNFIKHEIEATNEEKDQFISEIINKLPQILGNSSFIIHSLQYHIEEGHGRNYFHPMTIEAEIFLKVFSVSLGDSKRTITNKVKSFYEGKKFDSSDLKAV